MAVAYLYHNVAKTMTGDGIACDAGADGLPIKPYTAYAVDQDVVLDDDIYCGVQLDAADLGSAKLDIGVYVVDIIVLYQREYPSKVSHNASLTAVVDMVVADNVGAYVILVPAHVVGLED